MEFRRSSSDSPLRRVGNLHLPNSVSMSACPLLSNAFRLTMDNHIVLPSNPSVQGDTRKNYLGIVDFVTSLVYSKCDSIA